MNKLIKAVSMYGIAHGLATAAVMLIAYTLLVSFRLLPSVIVAGVIAAGLFAPYGALYWFKREAKARGHKQFWRWYPDSMFDFLTPLGVWVVGSSYLIGLLLWML